MADNFRYSTGETSPVQIALKTGVAVGVGDLCYEDSTDSNTVKPASSIPWDTTLAQTQIDFVASFLGISGQRYDGTNLAIGIKDGMLRIDTTGTYLMDCAAGSSFNVGDLVGPAQQPGGVLLLAAQTVALVNAKNQAVGRVERAVTGASKVLVRIFSTKQGVINT